MRFQAITPFLVIFASLTCAAQEASDTDRPDPDAAYVVVVPRVTGKAGSPKRVDLSLTCVDETRARQTLYLPNSTNQEPTLLRVKPGACFLSRIRIGPVIADFQAPTTAFAAYPKQVNYAGDWQLEIAPEVVSSGAGYSDRTAMGGHVVDSEETVSEIRRKLPMLTSAVRIEYTGPKDK
jgi:hypothetical protein